MRRPRPRAKDAHPKSPARSPGARAEGGEPGVHLTVEGYVAAPIPSSSTSLQLLASTFCAHSSLLRRSRSAHSVHSSVVALSVCGSLWVCVQRSADTLSVTVHSHSHTRALCSREPERGGDTWYKVQRARQLDRARRDISRISAASRYSTRLSVRCRYAVLAVVAAGRCMGARRGGSQQKPNQNHWRISTERPDERERKNRDSESLLHIN